MSTYQQFIYGLVDPLEPERIRYIGRTNDLDTRLRMHLADANWGSKVKDVWIMYLNYARRAPEMLIIEQASFDDKSEGEQWAKDRERYWISYHVQRGADLFNSPHWSSHSSRKPIPSGVKTAWCETHALLWNLDRNWDDELRLLKYLAEKYGTIMREERQPNGSVLCESMAELPIAKSEYQQRRYRAWSALRALLDAHPALSVGELDTVNLPMEENC